MAHGKSGSSRLKLGRRAQGVPPAPRGRRQGVALLLALVALLVGGPGAVALGRVRTDQTGRRVDVPEHPQRLISLAPSITETLYALGAGDLLVGDTDYCDYPPEAKLKPHVGQLLNPSLERIVALKPDLVVGSPEANRRETADLLERLHIPLYGLTAHTLDETLRSIEDLGDVIGREQEAKQLDAQLRRRVADVESRVRDLPRPKVLFVVWYRPLISAGPNTFISDVVRRAGGTSITDDLKSDWPHLSLEEAVHRNPDVLLFPGSESFAPSLDDFARLPGWKEMAAVKAGRMYRVSEGIMHPSPRLVDALEEVARLLHPEAVGAGKTGP